MSNEKLSERLLVWARYLKWYSVGGAIDRFASDIAALEQALEEARAERDAVQRQSEVLAANVADARLATLRECYRLLSATDWCGATSASNILELIDAEESKVGK